MSEEKKSWFRRATDKVFGGLNMSWPVVIIYAVVTAVVTAVILRIPALRATSIHKVGETLEAWILFGIIIMANCKKPLESALKTFVFFLISQPLIYLFQVPFVDLGWGLFQYYKFWFIVTLFTFPMAFVGWFIVKRKFYSLLILLPIMLFLTYSGIIAARSTYYFFPNLLIMALFCFGQVILYAFVFSPGKIWSFATLLVCVAAGICISIAIPVLNMQGSYLFPDEPDFSENAVITSDNPEVMTCQIRQGDGVDFIETWSKVYGTANVTVTDGDVVKHYKALVTMNDDGAPVVRFEVASAS